MSTSAERLRQYEDLFAQSQAYNPAQFQQDFERAYGEATDYNKDLIEARNTSIAQQQALPAQLREQYYSSPIRNPLQQEALIATRRGGITQDIANLQDLLTARGNRYQDILGKQLGMYETSAQQAQTAAENAWRLYQDVLAQEEAERNRRAAAAQQAALENLLRTQQQQEVLPQRDEIVIDTRDNNNWTQALSGAENPKVNILNALPLALGNYIGNTMVPKAGKPLNWWEKLTNLRLPTLGGGGGKSW